MSSARLMRSVSTLTCYLLIIGLFQILIPYKSNATTNAECSPTVSGVTASGVASGDDCIISFTSGSGTWTIPASIRTFSILVVGGGGGGGADAGSGGGGGSIYIGTVDLSNDSRRSASINVGNGGIPHRHSNGQVGTSGGNSSFTFTDQNSATFSITSYGGGVGQWSGATSAGAAGVGGATPVVTDNSGTVSVTQLRSQAGGAGGAGVSYNSTNTANNGTGGVSSAEVFGSSYSGGGGGGATQNSVSSPGRPGGTGVNGGGNGSGGFNSSTGFVTSFAVQGTTNSGGGGGAGSAYGNTTQYTIGSESYFSRDGKSGGSGVVRIRYTTTAPSAPTITSTSVSSSQITVNFSAPTFDGASTITGYQIEYSANGTSWTTASSSVAANATSYAITGLSPNTAYYIRMAATYSGGLGSYGYNWQKIHEVTSPIRNSGAITYASGFGLGTNDAAKTLESANFTRVRYRMQVTYSGANNYVDVDFNRTLGTTVTGSESYDSIARLRVPTTSGLAADTFEIHANVSDLRIESNVPDVENGSGFDGRLEIWPWNYDPAPASVFLSSARASGTYDDADSWIANSGTYGSFQLHRISSADASKRKTIFAWNRHYDSAGADIGIGNPTSGHSDWTFARENLSIHPTRTNFNLTSYANIPVTTLEVSPGAPTINSITASSSQLSVAFTAGSNSGSAITKYQYSTDGGSTWRDRASGTTASPLVITTISGAANTSLVNGTSYNVQIRAFNSIAGTASATTAATPLASALTPTFGSTTSTPDGFTVQISNYDSNYTWSGSATASGSVSISNTGLVTVTGVAASTSSTATITTTRSGYTSGSATVSATSLGGCSPDNPNYIVGFKILTFSSVGSCGWTTPAGVTSVDVLVVGGGGGGGGSTTSRTGGSGGAGGYFYASGVSISGSISIGVGAGGSGSASRTTRGTNGGDSYFGTLKVGGGGAGNGDDYRTNQSALAGNGGSDYVSSGNGGGGRARIVSDPAPNAWRGGSPGSIAVGGITFLGNTYTGIQGSAGSDGQSDNASGGLGGAITQESRTSSISGSSVVYAKRGTYRLWTDSLNSDRPQTYGSGGSTNYRYGSVTTGAGENGAQGVVILRHAVSTDTSLSNLVLSSGTLSPSFSPTTYSYTASIGDLVSSLSVTATRNQSAATLKVNNGTATSGSPHSLNITSNTTIITVRVTAEDTISFRDYVITLSKGTQLPLSITSRFGTVGQPLTLFATGGSGSGGITYSTPRPGAGTTSCTLVGSTLTAIAPAGSSAICYITATKAADAAFSAASSVETTIFFTAYTAPTPQGDTCSATNTGTGATGIGTTGCQTLEPVTQTQGDSGAAPKITSLSITSGLVGASVTITGTGFSAATRVQFGAKATTTFTKTATTITVAIPTGATTGRVMVVSPNGTAMASQIFTVISPDTRAPAFISGNVNTSTPTQVVLTFDETLASSNTQASAFAVSVNGENRVVSSVSISGTTVTLTLASAVTTGQTVLFTYTSPADSSSLQDTIGNRTATITATSVTNTL